MLVGLFHAGVFRTPGSIGSQVSQKTKNERYLEQGKGEKRSALYGRTQHEVSRQGETQSSMLATDAEEAMEGEDGAVATARRICRGNLQLIKCGASPWRLRVCFLGLRQRWRGNQGGDHLFLEREEVGA